MNLLHIATKSLPFMIIFSFAMLLVGCDEASSPEKAKTEGAEIVETVEEAEGAEGAKEALKKKGEEDAKEGEERKSKQEEKHVILDSMGKSSSGFKKR